MSAASSLASATRSLKTASLALADGDSGGTINRAYYAMYYAARAALLVVGQDRLAASKTHAGLIAAFGQHLIKAGHLPNEFGRAISSEASRRMVSDYHDEEKGLTEARVALQHAEDFVEGVTHWIAQREQES